MEILISENIYNNVDLLPLDLQGWSTDEIIFEELIVETKPKIIVEVGSWKGWSAIHMASLLKKHGLVDSKIICIDTWLGWNSLVQIAELHQPTGIDINIPSKNGYSLLYQQFLSNVIHTKNQKYILPLPMTSFDGVKYIKHSMSRLPIDLIYIDGCHDFFECYHDIKNYFQVLKKDGIMFGDDYCNDFKEVMLAFDTFCHDNNIIKTINGKHCIIKK